MAAGHRTRTLHHDSALGRWTLTTYRPCAELAADVAEMWEVEGVQAYRRDQVLPCGDVIVLFNLGQPQYLVEPDHQTAFRTAWVSGLQQRSLITEAHDGSHLIGLRLTPPGARRLMRLDMHELTNAVVPLDAVLGPAAAALLDRLRNAVGRSTRFALLEQALLARLRTAPAVDPVVGWAWRSLLASHGRARIAELADDIGCSRKHLAGRFRDAVGMAPKPFARLLKFARAIDLIETGNPVDLPDLAQACGYYDQAHFNREFRAFSSSTPGAYLRQRLPDAGGGFALVD